MRGTTIPVGGDRQEQLRSYGSMGGGTSQQCEEQRFRPRNKPGVRDSDRNERQQRELADPVESIPEEENRESRRMVARRIGGGD